MVFSDDERDSLFSDLFKSEGGGLSSYELLKAYFEGLSEDDPLNQMLFAEWSFQLPDQCLAFVDFLSMAHSVEVRSPFLDYRLVEYLARVPGSLKIRDGVSKDLLKKAVEGVIPAEVISRPKEGFVQPSNHWLPHYETTIRDRLSPGRLASHGLFNARYVQDLLDQHFLKGQLQSVKVWNLFNFQIWHDNFFSSDCP
jgi:asparagine synthase (glutamine-hydrolysing)